MRMRNLDRVITSIYADCSRNYGIITVNHDTIKSKFKYFEIPLDGDTYQVPLFAFQTFSSICQKVAEGKEMPQAIIATLQTRGETSYYKSVEAMMKEALYSSYYSSKLIKICLPDKYYYGTRGAIFDKDFNPLCVYTWKIQKVIDEDGNTRFQFIKPFLYISSLVYVGKNDAVQKFLSGRMLNTVLQREIYPTIYCSAFLRSGYGYFTPDVMICKEIPFRISTTETPSISTTNEQLINTVLEYKEDIWK